ncbi:MAG: helix-turn-helix domain-containing protein [Betaproteobacteria bacterium]
MTRYDTEGIGDRLREVRRARGFTIGRLAAASGVPASTISKIEKGRLRPSLVNAINLAGALEQNIGFLVSRYRHPPEPRVVVRAKKRETLRYGPMGLTLQDLNGHSMPGTLEARMGILGPGAHSGIEPMIHRGEELCYVLAGSIRYRIDDRTFDLAPGDCLQFKSDIQHQWENVHPGESRVLWMFSDGLSF